MGILHTLLKEIEMAKNGELFVEHIPIGEEEARRNFHVVLANLFHNLEDRVGEIALRNYTPKPKQYPTDKD